jgi:hypothetical protein
MPHNYIMKMMAITILFLLTLTASSYPDEAKGVVTRIVDGATFEVSELGCVRLADIVSVSPNSLSGLNAREFTRDNLMGTQIFLDIDDKTGQDSAGCWMCVVYRANANGTPNFSANFNKMYVDAGYGIIKDDLKTEFDPKNWSQS